MSEKTEIVSLANLSDAQVASITSQFDDVIFHHFPDAKIEDVEDSIWENCNILYTWSQLPAKAITPNLHWVQSLSAGVNTIVDNPIFKNSSVILTNSSGANAPQVAEHTLSLLLAMSRKIPDIVHHQTKGNWIDGDSNLPYQPSDLMNSTVGILGYGSIGRQIARLLQTFNCKVLVTKKDGKSIIDDGYILDNTGDKNGEFFTRLYPTEATGSVVSECDFVIVCLPLTSSTKGLINESILNQMKPSAVLIDVSRGDIVDHNALIGALVNNKIAGAALDVFPKEPLSNESSLWQFSNVLISPHVAGASPEYLNRALNLFLENLNRHFNGNQLLNIVETKFGY
jgi:phosphoglycerate dehydrogenase-like enzyme